MASAARSLRLVCRSCRSQRPIQKVGPKVFVAWKTAGGGGFKEVRVADDTAIKPTPFDHWEEEGLEIERKYKLMTPVQIAQSMLDEEDENVGKGLSRTLNSVGVDEEYDEDFRDDIENVGKLIRAQPRPIKEPFWDDEEPDPDLITMDDSDEGEENDMTDIAHAKLEEHREQREYARIAIWDMPLLSKLARPFEPPTMNEPLRFRYTSYLGEFHPAEKKVVVEFSPADFGLTEVQEMKLKKLAGSRYNPTKETIKMSCESFEHQAQNKRHLAELVQKLIADAKDPTDTFEDIPLDLRHHKIKIKPKFPLEWRMSEERMQQIVAYRDEAKQLEKDKKVEGRFIDGVKVINKALAGRVSRDALHEMATVSHKARQPRIRS